MTRIFYNKFLPQKLVVTFQGHIDNMHGSTTLRIDFTIQFLNKTYISLFFLFACSFVLDHTGPASVPLFEPSDSTTAKRNYFINSRDVKDALDKLQITNYTKHECTSSLNITSILAEDETEEGQLLLDFNTYTVDFKNSFSKETRDRVMKFFRENSHVETSATGGKKFYFDVASALFLISK